MRTPLLPALFLSAAFASPAFAEGGDRQPAGGAFMSSYSRGPYPETWRGAAPVFSPAAEPRSVEVRTTGSIRRRPPRSR